MLRLPVFQCLQVDPHVHLFFFALMNLDKESYRQLSRLSVCLKNRAGYTATEVACGWAGAIFEVKVIKS